MGVREGVNAFLSGYLPQSNLRFREHLVQGERRRPVRAVVCRGRQPPRADALPGDGERSAASRCASGAGSFAVESSSSSARTARGRRRCSACCRATSPSTPTAAAAAAARRRRSVAARLAQAAGGRPRRRRRRRRRRRTVRALLRRLAARSATLGLSQPLRVEALLENGVGHLSGGEQQRVALALALGAPADVYLIDEPSTSTRAAPRGGARAQALRTGDRQDGVRRRARLHDGVLPRRSRRRLRGTPSVAAVATAAAAPAGMNLPPARRELPPRPRDGAAADQQARLAGRPVRRRRHFFVGDVWDCRLELSPNFRCGARPCSTMQAVRSSSR